MTAPSSGREVGTVAACGVTRRFGTGDAAVTAVREVSLTVTPGERVAVVGRSGSGKSTLLSLLGLVDRPDDGEVRYAGEPTADLSADRRADLRRNGVGFVFQAFHLVPALSAIDNVTLPLLPYADRRATRDRGLDLLDRIGLADRARHLPSQLSGGEQQRVAIARALINRPQLVLADEPTGNLDRMTGDKALELLLDLQEDIGFALVVATHDPRLMTRLDRRVVLADGSVTEQAAIADETGATTRTG